jgi:hypothetical protein
MSTGLEWPRHWTRLPTMMAAQVCTEAGGGQKTTPPRAKTGPVCGEVQKLPTASTSLSKIWKR